VVDRGLLLRVEFSQGIWVESGLAGGDCNK
jgi:hypothetical protein